MLADIWNAYRELVKLGFPERYPLVQFPNPPLIVGVMGSVLASVLTGSAHDGAVAVGTMGITVWAYQEAVHGVNAFRHVLGIAMLVNTAVTLAGRLS